MVALYCSYDLIDLPLSQGGWAVTTQTSKVPHLTEFDLGNLSRHPSSRLCAWDLKAFLTTMEQWQAFSDTSTNHNRPYHIMSQHQQQQPRDLKAAGQQQSPAAGSSYEPYQSSHPPSQAQSTAASPVGASYTRPGGYNGDGDVAMQDADPYAKGKVTAKSNHQHRASLSASRNALQFGPHEESSAARKYSPMDTMSPSSPYPTGYQQPFQPTTVSQSSHRQSPTRPNSYSSSPQTYYGTSCMLLLYNVASL